MARRTSSTSSEALATVDRDLSPLDKAVGYQVPKTVALHQLQAELSAALDGAAVTVAMTGPVQSEQPVSVKNPQTLWLRPAGADASVVAQVVADHVPQQDWGVPAVTKEFGAVLSRLKADPTVELSPTDLETLIRGMAINFLTASPGALG